MNKTYKNSKLPFFELTYNQDINGCVKSHIHDKLAIIALSKGEMKLQLKDKDVNLQEKFLAVVNPYEIHSASKQDTQSKGLYALYLDKDWVEVLQNELFEVKTYIPFLKNIINDTKLCQSFLILCKYLFEDDFNFNKEEKIIEFISELMINNCEKQTIELKNKNRFVDDIKNYIDKNYKKNLSLADISKQFLITPFHLIRIFKKELFLTPHQYILNKKINLAKELLSQNIAISEVAITTGFNDQSHLYKYFKQTFSISPKEYQKSLMN